MLNAHGMSTKRLQGLCYNVTAKTANPYKGLIVFITDPPPMPHVTNGVGDMDAWRRIYTIIAEYATGSNHYIQTWLSMAAFEKLFWHIYRGERMDYHVWGVQNRNEFALKRLDKICSVWVDAHRTHYIRLAVAPSVPEIITYPAACIGSMVPLKSNAHEWRFRPLNLEENKAWRDAVVRMYDQMLACDLNASDYLLTRLPHITRRFPAVTEEWARHVRTMYWTMLMVHFPFGIDASLALPALKEMFGDEVDTDIIPSLTTDVLFGDLMDDLVMYVRESQCHATVYPRLFGRIGVPPIIRQSLEMKTTVTLKGIDMPLF